MRKNLILGLFALCVCGSCQQIALPEADASGTVANSRSVQFVMKGLEVDYGQTRATLASEGMTDLWVWEGETLLKHQVSTDTDFGTPTISMTIGAHDLTFVASKSDGQGFADGVWSCTKVKDTFGAVLSYTVGTSSTSKQVQLTRLNGKVGWTVEDAIPAAASTIAIEVDKQCYGLDADLDGVQEAKYSSTVNVSSYVGVSGLSLGAMVLPASHADGADVKASVSVKKGDGTVICAYDNDVTVKANRICNIHGAFFSGTGEHLVSLTADWGGTQDYDLH